MILCGIKSRKQKKTGLKGFEPLTDGLRVLETPNLLSENNLILSALENIGKFFRTSREVDKSYCCYIPLAHEGQNTLSPSAAINSPYSRTSSQNSQFSV
jgi:hypothetical protein